jgi:hypothetical protein
LGGCGERNVKIGDCDKDQSTREIVGRRVQATDLMDQLARTASFPSPLVLIVAPNNFGVTCIDAKYSEA